MTASLTNYAGSVVYGVLAIVLLFVAAYLLHYPQVMKLCVVSAMLAFGACYLGFFGNEFERNGWHTIAGFLWIVSAACNVVAVLALVLALDKLA